MLLPCDWYFWAVVLEKTLGSPLDSKEIQPVHPKGNQSWICIGRTDTETPILWPPWKRPWFWERLKAGGEGNDRGWGSWMASPTWWTWVWASSGSWWWTGKPGVLQSMGLQRLRHDWTTELTDWPCDYTHTITIAYYTGSKNLVPETVVSASPGNLLERHNLRHIESKLGVRDRNLGLRNPSRWSWWH